MLLISTSGAATAQRRSPFLALRKMYLYVNQFVKNTDLAVRAYRVSRLKPRRRDCWQIPPHGDDAQEAGLMRSMLFVPGDSPRKFEKASEGNADALIIDLEDSVVAEKKEEARKLTLAMLKGRRGSHQLYVRVNALDTDMTLADLAAVMPGAPDGIVLPKSRGGDDVRQLATWLEAFEAAAGTKVGASSIVCVATETAGSIFGLGSYKGCSPR